MTQPRRHRGHANRYTRTSGDPTSQSIGGWTRVDSAIVNGLIDLATSAVDAWEDVACASTSRERSFQSRRRARRNRSTDQSRRVDDWADFITDAADIFIDRIGQAIGTARRVGLRVARGGSRPARER